MPERDDELDEQSRAVLADLFTSALATPDPGSTVDLDSILRAARAAEPSPVPLQAVGGSTDPVGYATDPDGRPVDHDAIGRPSGRVRLWQTLGGLAAAAALVFGVVQIFPSSQSAETASMTDMPARAAEAPAAEAPAASMAESSAASGAESGEALAAPLQAEDSAAGGGAASSDGDQAAESSEAAASASAADDSATACALPSAAVLDAAAAAAPEWSVAELTGTRACRGFRLVGPGGEFDVLFNAGPGSAISSSPVAAAYANDLSVEAFPVPGASPDTVDVAVATAVVEAVAAAAG